MTTINPTNAKAPIHSGNYGNLGVYADSAAVSATALAIGDKVRLARVPAGTKVSRVVIKNADLDTGTTLQASLGFEPEDGSAVSGSLTAVAAAGAWAQTAATTTYEIFPPYLVAKDSFLAASVTAAATGGAAGTVHGKVEGEVLGAK